MPNKPEAALTALEFLGQRISCLERDLGSGLSLVIRIRADKGARWDFVCTNPRATGSDGGTIVLPGGVFGRRADHCSLIDKPKPHAPFCGGGKVRVSGYRSEKSDRSRVGILQEALADFTSPLGRQSQAWAP